MEIADSGGEWTTWQCWAFSKSQDPHYSSGLWVAVVTNDFVHYLANYRPFELPRGKTNNVVSEQVQHKPAYTSTEKSYKLDISDLSKRNCTIRVAKTKALISFAGHREADLHLCFRLCRLLVFP